MINNYCRSYENKRIFFILFFYCTKHDYIQAFFSLESSFSSLIGRQWSRSLSGFKRSTMPGSQNPVGILWTIVYLNIVLNFDAGSLL